MKNVSFVSLTTHTRLIFDDFSCFFANSEAKIHKTLVFLNKTPPILDFRAIRKQVDDIDKIFKLSRTKLPHHREVCEPWYQLVLSALLCILFDILLLTFKWASLWTPTYTIDFINGNIVYRDIFGQIYFWVSA